MFQQWRRAVTQGWRVSTGIWRSSDEHQQESSLRRSRYGHQSVLLLSLRIQTPDVSGSEESDVLRIEVGKSRTRLFPHLWANESLRESKLDERFLPSRPQPSHQGLPFFPYTEVLRPGKRWTIPLIVSQIRGLACHDRSRYMRISTYPSLLGTGSSWGSLPGGKRINTGFLRSA